MVHLQKYPTPSGYVGHASSQAYRSDSMTLPCFVPSQIGFSILHLIGFLHIPIPEKENGRKQTLKTQVKLGLKLPFMQAT